MADINDAGEQPKNWREERRRMRDEWRSRYRDSRSYMTTGRHVQGRLWTGIFILLIGIVLLLNALGFPIPGWVFTWQVLLIALGIFIGIRHRFHNMSWLILIIIGGAFLARDMYPDIEMRRFIWPAILILLGFIFILRPRNRWCMGNSQKKNPDGSGGTTPETLTDPAAIDSKDDFVNATSIFGGTKKNILSKKFKGGEIVNIFGGTELNLSQADITGEAIIETTTIFGGTKLVIPSNWTIKSDAAVIFGGIEDKRPVAPVEETNHRILRIKGTVIFGGIDIKSY
ncbi:MAG: hypothetical protein JST17_02620 [Bacteroidetes bacterium]|nr:hypothetical protein [Bacteroidota bacterium]MBS1931201.1 hypothetical protein [Bacteroidota bacterium]